MNQGTFDDAERRLREAAERGERGMQQAAEHADRDRGGWTDDAYAAVCAAARRPGEFTFEELRREAQASIDEPPDLRAWGTVAKRAIRERVIVPTGHYAPRASGNCTPTMTYVAGSP